MTHLQGSEKFHGKILHSSQLDGVDVAGKNVAIIGVSLAVANHGIYLKQCSDNS